MYKKIELVIILSQTKKQSIDRHCWLQSLKIQQHGFDIMYLEEDTGFAKYKGEDPYCIRAILKKR